MSEFQYRSWVALNQKLITERLQEVESRSGHWFPTSKPIFSMKIPNQITIGNHSGGNLVFRGGQGFSCGQVDRAYGGSIILQLPDGTQFMRIEPTGKVFIRDKEIDDEYDIYLHFWAWIRGIAPSQAVCEMVMDT